MPVTYSQTPPPVVEEREGEVVVSPQLRQVALVGFSGAERGCMKLLVPQPARIVFTVGASLVVRDLETGRQEVHLGHSYPVSCLSLSSSGRYLASGERASLGVRARLVCWDTTTWTCLGSHQTHHGKVEAADISEDEKLLVSLGGEDDGSLVVWSITDRRPLTSTTVGDGKSGPGRVISFLSPDSFLTGGRDLLQTWQITGGKLSVTNISLGKLKREVVSVERDPGRDCVYCGTSSGDILKIVLNSQAGGRPALLAACVRKPRKGQPSNAGRFSGGVNCLQLLDNGDLLVGCGNGDLVCVEQTEIKKAAANQVTFPTSVSDPTTPSLLEKRLVRLAGSLTSLALSHGRREVLVATSECSVLSLTLLTFTQRTLLTCPASAISSVTFPQVSNKVYAIAGDDGVQLWTDGGQRLLAVTDPSPATRVCLSRDGRYLISGWADSSVRLHTPQSGKLVEEIRNCVTGKDGVTAMDVGREVLVVGGGDGSVRLWSLAGYNNAKLIKTVKEHRSKVSSAHISPDGKFALTTATDGAGILWNIPQMTRALLLRGSGGLIAGRIHPNNVHAVILGVDNRLGYWDTVTGEQLRNIEAVKRGQLTCMDLSPDGM